MTTATALTAMIVGSVAASAGGTLNFKCTLGDDSSEVFRHSVALFISDKVVKAPFLIRPAGGRDPLVLERYFRSEPRIRLEIVQGHPVYFAVDGDMTVIVRINRSLIEERAPSGLLIQLKVPSQGVDEHANYRCDPTFFN